jgi:hypothetical protein
MDGLSGVDVATGTVSPPEGLAAHPASPAAVSVIIADKSAAFARRARFG